MIPPTPERITGLVLAGGLGRRMGGVDKGLSLLDGEPLVEHIIRRLAPQVGQLIINANQNHDIYAGFGYPVVGDRIEGHAGPLAGLCAGLDYASQDGVPWIFAVATDMPFVRPALIEQLANYRSGVDAVVPLVDGHPQPLAAFYSIDALPAVRALATGEGKRSLRAALERLQVAYVHAADLITADPGLDSFVDLDTPEDLAKDIEALL